MQTEHSPFPSDETLAAFIDGQLDEETRGRVVWHIAECPECLDIVTASNEMKAAPVVRGVNWRNRYTGLAAAAAAIAIVLALPATRERLWPPDDIGRLAAAAPKYRVGDGRVTHFPFQEVRRMRGSEPANDPMLDSDNYKYMLIVEEVRQKAEERKSASALHALGVAQLGLRDEYRHAVTTLEEALRAQTKPDAQLLSDLAAAYIAAGDFQRAHETSERAWQLAQTPEIAWNRAVAAEHVDPPPVVIAKWNKYLELDPSSPWSAAARKRLDDFQEGLKYRR